MIADARISKRTHRSPEWQTEFLDMLPKIRECARFAFRGRDAEAREEAIQETVVSAMMAYIRLWERGKQDLAYPTVLARFAIVHYRSGRRVGSSRNCEDIMSSYAWHKQGFRIESLDGQDENGEWREALAESKQAGPAETAASRMDFAAWLDALPSKRRTIALILARGETTSAVAKEFNVTLGRISQVRRELLESWGSYHAESTPVV